MLKAAMLKGRFLSLVLGSRGSRSQVPPGNAHTEAEPPSSARVEAEPQTMHSQPEAGNEDATPQYIPLNSTQG